MEPEWIDCPRCQGLEHQPHRADCPVLEASRWPCDKRTAHGPHEIRSPECPDYDCPGVKAHPATMIGRPGR